MKRIVSLVLALIIILSVTGCGNGKIKDATVSYTTGENLNNQQYYLADFGNNTIAEGPDAYYVIAEDYLHYMDKNTLESGILCGKADCKHNKETDYERAQSCEAFHFMPMSVFYYDNGIYIYELTIADLGMNNDVIRYNLQGQFEKKIATIPTSVTNVIQHKGIMYYIYSELDETSPDNTWGDFCLVAFDLNTGDKKIIAQWSKDEYVNVSLPTVHNDKIYMMADKWQEGGQSIIYQIAVCDIATGKIDYIKAETADEGISKLLFVDDKLVYNCSKFVKNESTGIMEPDKEYGKKLFTANPDGSTARQIGEVKYAFGATFAYDDILLVSNIADDDYDETGIVKYAIYKNYKYIGEFDLSGVTWENDGEQYNGAEHIPLAISEMGDYICFTVARAVVAVEKADLKQGKAEPFVVIVP